MNIEEIMKPYFDKKNEFSKRHEFFENGQNEIISKYEEENKNYSEIIESYEKELAAINVRLQNSINNRSAQIEEYVKNAVADRPEFYAGYGAMIRKDLEQEYIKREKALEAQKNELIDKINDYYLKIEENDRLIEEAEKTKKVGEINKFYNVDVRELVDIKHDLRKELISAKKELEIKIREVSLRFEAVMYKLSTFKYQYDENHNVLNSDQYRTLFEQSNSLIEVKYNLQKDLKQVDEYLKITELTEEEVKIVMMSMTDQEKEEYNRRKNLVQSIEEVLSPIEIETNNVIEEPTPIEVKEEIEEAEETIVEPMEEANKEAIVNENENLIYEQASAAIENKIQEEDNYSKFINKISDDVLRSIKKLRTIKVQDGKIIQTNTTKEYKVEGSLPEEIELANGLYLNRHDVEHATKKYKKQSKGRTFTVKGIDLVLTVTKESVKKVKEALRKVSLQELLNEKKISIFDVKRVYGKEKAEKYVNYNSNIELKTEDYIRVEDAYEAFKELLFEKAPTWVETVTSKSDKVEESKEVQEANYVQVEDEMTWNAEEPEYEVVKAKTK